MPAHWPFGAPLRTWVAARTEFFDEMTLAALQDGIAQVVIVGAGYDARALRFARSRLRMCGRGHRVAVAGQDCRLLLVDGLGACQYP